MKEELRETDPAQVPVDRGQPDAADPAEVGFDPTMPDRLVAALVEDVTEGLTRGVQVYVARHGRSVVDAAVGRCGTKDRALSTTTRFPIFSASKPVAATAVHLLVDRGQLVYHDPIARYVPEFAAGGKGIITFHHALLHLAGIADFYMRWVPPEAFADWDAAIADICALPLESYPGLQPGYHPLTTWGVMAEAVRRIDGRPFDRFCIEEILEPLGMTRSTWGLPDDLLPEATMVAPGSDDPSDIYRRWAAPELRSAVLPGGGLYATASDVGRFYTAWCAGGGPLLAGPVAAHAVRRLGDSGQPDSTAGLGYGFSVGADANRLFVRGSLTSNRSFGHTGAGIANSWADPATGLVCVVLTNAACPQPASDRRFHRLSDIVHAAVRT